MGQEPTVSRSIPGSLRARGFACQHRPELRRGDGRRDRNDVEPTGPVVVPLEWHHLGEVREWELALRPGILDDAPAQSPVGPTSGHIVAGLLGLGTSDVAETDGGPVRPTGLNGVRVSGRQLTVVVVVVTALAVASGLSLAFAVRDSKGTSKSPGPRRPKVKPAPDPTRSSTAPAAVRLRPRRGDRESTATGAAVDAWRAPLAQALAGGVRAAERDGGSAAAAAWVVGWGAPIVVGDDRLDRMWSISKPVAAIATLEAYHDSPASGLDQALTAAIQRSDNCAERGVVLS